MKKFYFRGLYILIVSSLFILPILQLKYQFISKTNITGVSQTVNKPTFSYNDIKSGDFQKQYENWFNQNYGLKDIIVKTNNQIYYSLFNETPQSSQVILGKSGQLIESIYISEYLNLIEPLNVDFLESKVKQIKELQVQLNSIGKTHLLLITPSKASIYPEYIPERYKMLRVDKIRNYDLLIPLLDKYGVNYIDGHKITLQHKLEDKYEMFPKGGTHWTNLAAYYTAKETVDFIEELRNIDMVNMVLESVELSYPEKNTTDRDLADLLNVFTTPVNYKIHRPVINADSTNKVKPSFLIEGGSFSEQFISVLSTNKVFSNIDLFFYYNTHIHVNPGEAPFIVGELNNLDWEKEVLGHDIIITEMNEQNIPKLQSGLIQDMLLKLKPLIFTYINDKYVEKIADGNIQGYRIKKGADSTIFLETEKLNLVPNKEYKITYKAKGFHALNCDLFPDELPQFNNLNISDDIQEYSFIFKSDNNKMQDCSIRFFIDGINGQTDKDLYLYDIKLTPIQ